MQVLELGGGNCRNWDEDRAFHTKSDVEVKEGKNLRGDKKNAHRKACHRVLVKPI